MNMKYLWGIISAICFGSLTTFAKLSMLDSNAETTLILRFLLVSSIIFIFILLFKDIKLLNIIKNPYKLILLGIFFSFETIFFWWALGDMDIIPFLALFWSYPMMILLINSVLEYKINLKSIFLVILGFFGVFLATGGFESLCF